MGMFDSIFDAKGNDWQTKAFGRTLEQWEVGSEIPGAHPLPFQVEVLGGEINEPGDFVESFVTIRDRRVVAVPAERDESLPLLHMDGGWAPAPGLVAEVERLQGAVDAIESAWHTGTEGRDDGSLGYGEAVESAMDMIWSVLVKVSEPAATGPSDLPTPEREL